MALTKWFTFLNDGKEQGLQYNNVDIGVGLINSDKSFFTRAKKSLKVLPGSSYDIQYKIPNINDFSFSFWFYLTASGTQKTTFISLTSGSTSELKGDTRASSENSGEKGDCNPDVCLKDICSQDLCVKETCTKDETCRTHTCVSDYCFTDHAIIPDIYDFDFAKESVIITNLESSYSLELKLKGVEPQKWLNLAFASWDDWLYAYLNGELTDVAKNNGFLTGSYHLNIGTTDGSETNVFYMNDFRVYDCFLTESDAKRIYNSKIMEIVSFNNVNIPGLFYDRSGFLLNRLGSSGLTYSGGSMYFNGESDSTGSFIKPTTTGKGLNGVSGGTLSIWFMPLSKPTDNRVIYVDPYSHMGLGFYNSGNHFLITSSGISYAAYSTNNIKYGEWNNVMVSYNRDSSPSMVYINGIEEADIYGSSYWTEYKNLVIGGKTYNATSRFNGYINKVTVYNKIIDKDNWPFEIYEYEKQIIEDEWIESIKLDYLTFTGNQYLKFPAFDNIENIKIVLEFIPGPEGSQPTLMGVDGDTIQVYRRTATNMGIWWKSGGAYDFGTFNSGAKNTLQLEFTPQTFSFDLNGYKGSYSNSELYDKLTGKKIIIGGYNPGTSVPYYGKLMGVHVYLNGVLKYDCIPGKLTNKGLYDKVGSDWYYSMNQPF